MQPEIPVLDRFFIRFAASFAMRLTAWAMAIAILALVQSLLLAWLVLVPLFLHGYGIWALNNTHPLLEEKLADVLMESGREHCSLDETCEAFGLRERSGEVEHFMLRGLPSTMDLTIVAPLESCAIISKHSGTIFPPRWLYPLEFHTKNGSQTEIYYSDVNYVEYDEKLLTLHFSNGKTFEISGDNGAEEAVTALRTRLREHKGGF